MNNIINKSKKDSNINLIWKEYKQELLNTVVTENIISDLITSFYTNIIKNSGSKLYNYAIILKVEFSDKSVRSISNLIILNNKNSFREITDLLLIFWKLRSEEYHMKQVTTIFLLYRELAPSKKSLNRNIQSLISLSQPISVIPTEYNYKGYNLPITTNLLEWGKILSQDQNNSVFIESRFKILDQSLHFNVFKYEDHNIVQVFFNRKLLFNFKDYFIRAPLCFKRIIQNNEFIYQEGTLVSKKIERKVQYIKPLSKSLDRTTQFITLDIETKNINNILRPICVSLFDGSKAETFFIDDFNSELEMFSSAFNSIKARKYNYQKIYVHNLSHFDGVFLVKILSELGNLRPIIRNGQIYNLRLELKGDKGQTYIFYIRDSLLLLPVSLDKLSKSFKVKNPKLIFPIFSLNNYRLDYIGKIPNSKYFKKQEDYNNYISYHKGEWILRNELKKYCENDVISLHQVISKFSSEIFNLFRVDVLQYMTLSSLSLAIFRSNYLKELNIPKISGQMFEDIYKSYKGGLVDMYLPEGINLFLQDINSQYPEAMTLDMPGGKVYYVEGDLDLNDNNNFGFFKASIVANKNLDKPVLPIRFKNNTLCTLGSWTDWYFSEELKEAKNKYGYEITVEKGYIFERINIFKDYVNTLYSIKSLTPKNESLYLITKLLLNMLYGRFGMKPDKEKNLILTHEEAENYYYDENIIINDIITLGNGKEILRLILNSKYIENENLNSNISIAIASAIVAYARIKINSLKYLKGIKVYYSDTDSIITDKLLPKYLLGNKLGQLKIESNIKLGYFLAPKVYGYLDNDYNETVKIKGLKNPFTFFELSKLLYKNSMITKYQEKWYRNWDQGNISIRKELYTLLVTDNKRQLIYDSFGKLIGTKPYIYENGTILNKNIEYIHNIKEPSFKDKLIIAPK